MNNLKECPFCGSNKVHISCSMDRYEIICRNCVTVKTSFVSKDKSIDSWNSRPTEDKLREALEELVEALRDALGWVESHHDMHEFQRGFGDAWKVETSILSRYTKEGKE